MKKIVLLILLLAIVTSAFTACPRREIPVLTAEDLGPPPIVLPDWVQQTWGHFTVEEAKYNGIIPGQTSVAELLELLGEPDAIEETADPGMLFFHYLDASYFVDDVTVFSITIHRNSEAAMPRNIMIGDRFEEVIRRFPQEHNFHEPAADGIYYLYGQDIDSGEPVVFLNRNEDGVFYELIAISEEWPFIRISFNNGVVSSVSIYAYPF